MRLLMPALPCLAAAIGAFAVRPGHDTAVPLPTARQGVAITIDSLRSRLVTRIAATPGAEVAVWFQDLARRDSLALDAGVSFHPASTMKVPVMIELFRRVDAGKASLATELFLQNAFESIADRSIYALDAKDDSDSSLYARVQQNVTLRELAERMITRSSNLATNTLIQYLDPERITATAHALGARDMRVLRGVEDTKAFARGLNNSTTAHDLGMLLAAIERGRAASRASCDSMRQVLLRQEFHDEIPAGLPPGTPVAHKTGWITGTLHDAAIVYPKGRGPYVLVVLTRKIPEEKVAQALIADISREVYRFVMK